ncbi:MAG: tetratricopeptide repeat protein [Chthonomonas sp.]|nr:tetratricopeptide repeat protein [Chthonomonas sp.]
MKNHLSEESRESLALTQLPHDPRSFASVVSEVYLLEYGAKTQLEIAEVIGKNKSRVTQVYGDPTKLKADTIKMLLEPLEFKANKKRIVDAWVREVFGDDIKTSRYAKRIRGTATPKTLRRVDRMIREWRTRDSAVLAFEGFTKAEDYILQEQLLDRLYYSRFLLGEIGYCVSVCRVIAERARQRGDELREASAYLRQARLVALLPETRPEDLESLFERVEAILARNEPSSKPEFLVATPELLYQTRLGTICAFVERKHLTAEDAKLAEHVQVLQAWLKKKLSLHNRYWAHLMLGRIHLILGQLFQAQEHLEQARELAGDKLPHAREEVGVLYGRLLAARGEYQEALSFLRAQSLLCYRRGDRFYQAMTELELARTKLRH